MAKAVEFTSYNGWTNYATWAAFTHITDNEKARQAAVSWREELKKYVKLKMHNAIYTYTREYVWEMLLQDLLTCATQWMNWYDILLGLRGQPLKRELTNLDVAAITYFETIPGIWQTIVRDAKGGSDQALKDWALDSLAEWMQSSNKRYDGSPVSIFLVTCFDAVFGSIDWDRLTEALKEG